MNNMKKDSLTTAVNIYCLANMCTTSKTSMPTNFKAKHDRNKVCSRLSKRHKINTKDAKC